MKHNKKPNNLSQKRVMMMAKERKATKRIIANAVRIDPCVFIKTNEEGYQITLQTAKTDIQIAILTKQFQSMIEELDLKPTKTNTKILNTNMFI